MVKKKILWFTADFFIDVDRQLVPYLRKNSEYEIKGVVSINAIALQQDELSVITSVEQEKNAPDTDAEVGLVGYIVQKDDKMWDIAKKYRTTVENIMEINDLTSDSIKTNDRLIIARM